MNIPAQLYLKPDEAKFLSMAVVDCLEHIQGSANNPDFPWTPEARKDMREMIDAGKSLRIKLGKLGFDVRDLPPYFDSDLDTFFTKES